MRNILFEHNERLLVSGPTPRPATAPLLVGRRLLGITITLPLSGGPPANHAARLLLARYVAGTTSLAGILPLV